jgi:hypothetical protein
MILLKFLLYLQRRIEAKRIQKLQREIWRLKRKVRGL